MTEYDDGLIVCTDTELVIRRYDLLLRSGRIPYAQIRRVERMDLGPGRRWRIWGSGDLRHWFNYDSGRPRKTVGLVLDVGTGMKPVLTPADPERVATVLRSHGVDVPPPASA